MTLITVINLYTLNEKVWFRLFILWFLIVFTYKIFQKMINLSKNNKNKENEWFYLFLDIIMAINAPFIIFIEVFPLLIIWIILYGILLWYWSSETSYTKKSNITEEERISTIEKKELMKLKHKRDKKYGNK
ncbi:hypothetical protein [Lactococcus garvieae]|uniref:hypothetical protein n=1 Tax=Lactococcus garvieae TaxID=1363 RepID=UPI00398F6ECD